MVPDAEAVEPVNAAGISPKQSVTVEEVTVPAELMMFSIKVNEATLVQPLAELTVTSIKSPPLSVNE